MMRQHKHLIFRNRSGIKDRDQGRSSTSLALVELAFPFPLYHSSHHSASGDYDMGTPTWLPLGGAGGSETKSLIARALWLMLFPFFPNDAPAGRRLRPIRRLRIDGFPDSSRMRCGLRRGGVFILRWPGLLYPTWFSSVVFSSASIPGAATLEFQSINNQRPAQRHTAITAPLTSWLEHGLSIITKHHDLPSSMNNHLPSLRAARRRNQSLAQLMLRARAPSSPGQARVASPRARGPASTRRAHRGGRKLVEATNRPLARTSA